MKKSIENLGLDVQYGSIGSVFKTDDDDYKVISTDSLKHLIQELQSLRSKTATAFYRGNDVQFNSDKLSGAVIVLSSQNNPTGEVIVSKSALEDLCSEKTSGLANTNMIINLNNKIKSLTEELKAVKDERQALSEEVQSLSALKSENEKLKEEIASLNKTTTDKNTQKMVDTAISQLKEKNREVDKLKEELNRAKASMLASEKVKRELELIKKTVAERDRKIEELQDLQAQNSSWGINTESDFKDVRQKGVQARVEAGRALSALIVSLTVQGHKPQEVQDILCSSYDKVVSKSTIYNAISVKQDSDRKRILDLMKDFSHLMSGISEEDLIEWFDATRIKKMKLISKDVFVARYGVDVVSKKDVYVSGDFYYPAKL